MNSPHASAAGLRRITAAALAFGPVSSLHADLVAWWPLNQVSSTIVYPDSRAGLPARALGGATLTADAGGHTGAAGDRAASFGVGAQRIHLADASYFTGAASGNVLSVSYWIRQNAIRNATMLSFVAPSTSGGRGFQTHSPWSDGTIYFDTGGCCDGTMRTAFNPGANWTVWHHIALVKDGANKTIFLDGVQIATGVNTAPISVAFTQFFLGNSPGLGEAVNGDVDDFAVFSHALTLADAVALFGGISPDALLGVTPTDSEPDGLPDMWEIRTAGNLVNLTAAGQDFDSDGLDNAGELALGTNPTVGDTDADGASDNVETLTGVWVSLSNRGTDPTNADTDGDGLLDGVETNSGTYVNASDTGTSPYTTDYDSDLVNDRMEVLYGSNPVNNASTPILVGVPTLLAWWEFNDATNPTAAADTRVGHIGTIQGAAAYSADAGGQTGLAGDRALSITAAGGKMRLNDASAWINMATRLDKFTLTFWQKNSAFTPPAGQSSFWFVSPSSADGARGFQAHCPWDSNTIYYDTAGASNGTVRLNGPVVQDWSVWRHYVFLKNGTTKKVYVDGTEVLSSTIAAPLKTDFNAINIGSDNGAGSMQGLIDDVAIFAAPLSTQDITDLATRVKTPGQVGSSADSDGDGLVDAWELIYFPGDLTKLSSAGDFDLDGSTDGQEQTRDTHPNDSDTDDDTLLDGVETKTGVWVSNTDTGTDPKKADTDGDGLSDGIEDCSGVYTSPSDPGSNPNLPDSDADGATDGVEVLYNTNPNNAGSTPVPPGSTVLLAWWPFNDASNAAAANDVVVGIPGANTGTYTPDGGGRSGNAGDLAMCFDPNQAVTVNAQFMNLATSGDAITISFWQKLDTVRQSSAFWVSSPSSSGASGNRGLQAHTPWENNFMYFDHSGCCTAGVDRIDGPLTVDPTVWRHFAFVKKGATVKQIYVDGVLAVNGAGSAPLKTDLTTLTIGGGPAGYMDGYIDDFAVFAGGLTHAQICRLTAGETPSAILTPGPGGPFEITAVQLLPANQIQLTWNSTPGCTYRIEISSELAPGTWSDLATGIPSAGTTTVSVQTLPGGSTRHFLRVTEM